MKDSTIDEDEFEEEVPVQIPGLDVKKGLGFYEDDLEIYTTLLRSYVTNAFAVINRMRVVSKETLPDYIIAVHGFKGISANIAADKIREDALKMEKMARLGDLEGVLAENETFLRDTENTILGIKAWLEEQDRKGL